jgi:hypothetical protein
LMLSNFDPQETLIIFAILKKHTMKSQCFQNRNLKLK